METCSWMHRNTNRGVICALMHATGTIGTGLLENKDQGDAATKTGTRGNGDEQSVWGQSQNKVTASTTKKSR